MTSPVSVEPTGFKAFWNRVVPLRIKYLIITAACTLILVVSFQVQTTRLADARSADLKDNQTQQCYARVNSRDDLRSILFYVVDLNDVLPDDQGADLYTRNRTTFIDHNYPALSKAQCDVDGSAAPLIPNATTTNTESP
jgi:hypothetical protein